MATIILSLQIRGAEYPFEVSLETAPAPHQWSDGDVAFLRLAQRDGTSIGLVHGELVTRVAIHPDYSLEIDLVVPFHPGVQRLPLRLQWLVGQQEWQVNWVPLGSNSNLFGDFFDFATGYGFSTAQIQKIGFTSQIGSLLRNYRGSGQSPSSKQVPNRSLEPGTHIPTGGIIGVVDRPERFSNIGLLSVDSARPGDDPELVLVFVPWASGYGTGSSHDRWLDYETLRDWRIWWQGDEAAVWYVQFFPFRPPPAGEAWRPTWRTLAQAPAKRGGVVASWLITPEGQPVASLMNEWNRSVDAILRGKPWRAGRPFQPLPRVEFKGPTTAHDLVPLFVVESTAKAASARWSNASLSWSNALRRIGIVDPFGDKRGDFELHFYLAGPQPFAYDPLTSPSLVLSAQLPEKDHPRGWTPGISDQPKTYGNVAMGEMGIVELYRAMSGSLESFGDTPTALDCKLEIRGATGTLATEPWRLGALEVILNVADNGASTAQLRLTGSWDAQRIDLYPEITLTLQCKVRLAATDDPSEQEITAEFDTRDIVEELLQKEGSAFVDHSDEGAIDASLEIRWKSEGGLNPVMRMAVLSTSGSPQIFDSKRFYLNMRPFTVARLIQQAFDPEAGEVLAQWYSDDSLGPQWRLGSGTIEIQFPPQAVGEEMERGTRFWEGTRYIAPGAPLKYRFSPPTSITLRGSQVDRRYQSIASNLREILRHADVLAFTTEMAYPLAIDFARDKRGLPDVRMSEAGEFFGAPADNLPIVPLGDRRAEATIAGFFSGALAAWATQLAASVQTGEAPTAFVEIVRIRDAHASNRANFVARLGEYRLYDPYRHDGLLALADGLQFTIRGKQANCPAVLNPLPGTPELSADNTKAIATFLDNGAWGTEAQGAIRAGIIHTFEFASEFVAVLRNPQSRQGLIQSLAFSALGATGEFEASFDEGRTAFTATVNHGQLSRLIKTRIGRIGVVWNIAKHVVVYERSAATSRQFQEEQLTPSNDPHHVPDPIQDDPLVGWPVIRKTEEYIEILEPRRRFDEEESSKENRVGPLGASVFVSRRIYVNGAWGRNLDGIGYEIPLWNPDVDASLYPKPTYVLEGWGAEAEVSRNVHGHPEDLYFYSNTQPGTGADPNRWAQQLDVDFFGFGRPNVSVNIGNAADILAGNIPIPSVGSLYPGRFNFRVRPENPTDLQHGRSPTPMLASIDQFFISRSGQASPGTPSAVPPPSGSNEGVFAGFATQISSLIAKALSQADGLAGLDCASIVGQLKQQVAAAYNDANQRVQNSLPRFAPLDAQQAFGRLQSNLMDVFQAARSQASAQVEIWRSQVEMARQAGLQQRMRLLVDARASMAARIDRWKRLSDDAIRMPLEQVRSAKTQMDTALASVQRCGEKLADLIGGQASDADQRLAEARVKLADARTALQRVNDPRLRDVVEKFIAVLALTDTALQMSQSRIDVADSATFDLIKKAAAAIGDVLVKLDDFATEVAKALDECATQCDAAITAVGTRLDAALALLDAAIANASDTNVDAVLTALGKTDAAASDLVHDLKDKLDLAYGGLQAHATPYVDKANTLRGKLNAATDQVEVLAGRALQQVYQASDKLLDQAAQVCSDAQERFAQVRDQCNTWMRDMQAQALQKVSDVVTSDYARQFVSSATAAVETGSKALKLARAVGDLPKLPELTFNVDRAEYVFDDLKAQITTSPFAAKVREIEGGLKELGVALPCSSLLNQFLPMDWGVDLDADEIIKNLGGMQFSKKLFNFKLPGLDSDHLKVQHGVDKATRTAWVKARLNYQKADRTQVFDLGPLSLYLSAMDLFAESDIRVDARGERKSSSTSRITGNWALGFSGSDMVTFRDVAINYDGSSGFSFNVSPNNIELHPTIKFISDFAKRFGEDIPPNIQIQRDDRGRPTGVSAAFITKVVLPPMGNVKIAPFDIASGLGLRMEGSLFLVTANFSLGTRAAPVFVEVNLLGGGFFIELTAIYPATDSSPKLQYEGRLGLTLGSAESFIIAGIARGSYSILMFAYLSASNQHGCSLSAGLLISGSARILGIANASVTLLLEVRSQEGGKLKGYGSLDVEIDICWCYTLRVHEQVEHDV